MEQNELDPVVRAEEKDSAQIDTVSGDNKEKQSLWRRVRARLPHFAVWARYLLPAYTWLLLFVMSFFYNVKVYSAGIEQEASILRLYLNTFKGMHDYLGGATNAGRSGFYGVLVTGACVGVLCFLLALFLVGLATFTAVHAFCMGYESKESDRMKLIFKIAFPNRLCLFLSNLLILVPFLYPHFFSLVGKNFLAIGGGDVIFVMLNRPLIVGAVLTVLTLMLALIIPRYERQKKMNMFLLHRSEKSESNEQEDVQESK